MEMKRSGFYLARIYLFRFMTLAYMIAFATRKFAEQLSLQTVLLLQVTLAFAIYGLR